MKVKHELGFVYITSDGKRFLKKSEAEKHEKKLKDNQNDYIEWNK